MNENVRSRRPGRARSAVAGPPPIEATQYLTFVLDREVFAVEILMVREIIRHSPLTEMPMAPPWISGVINLRGAAVPVVDPVVRFGRPAPLMTKRTCILIMEVDLGGKRQDVGLVVDAVNAVLEIPATDIEAAPPFGAKISADFIRGVGRVGGRFVIILDVDRIVAGEALVALMATDRVAAGAG